MYSKDDSGEMRNWLWGRCVRVYCSLALEVRQLVWHNDVGLGCGKWAELFW
jgi:NOL1/NOP2/fmu family ribosome biogenesis protein